MFNISRLSPLRRGYVIGYRRARHKAQAELEALRHDYHELAVEHVNVRFRPLCGLKSDI